MADGGRGRSPVAPPRAEPQGFDSSGRMREYLRAYPRTDPGHTVARIAARHIRRAAAERFHGRLIDIGCGEKRKALLVGDLVDEHVGLDHADSPHDLGAVDLVGTAYAIPAADASFDCALGTAVLEHLEEPGRALAEAFRVLRPGSFAVYTAPLFWHLHEEPRDFFRYTRHGLRHLFEGAGFELMEIRPLGGFWTTVCAETGYYIQRFGIGPLRPLIGAAVAALHLVAAALDRGRLRDEAFTWMYLVVARKPVGPP